MTGLNSNQFEFFHNILLQTKRRDDWGIRGNLYTTRDYLLWMFAYSYHYANYGHMLIHLNGLSKAQIKKKVEDCARLISEKIKFDFQSYETHLKATNEMLKNDDDMKDFRDHAAFIIDGSSVDLYNPQNPSLSRAMYCTFKKRHQLRFQVVMDVRGYVVWLSAIHEGNLSDDQAMKRDAENLDGRSSFNEAFCLAFKNIIGEKKKPVNKIGQAKFVILADKGYGKLVPPPLTEVWLTASATDANPRGTRYVSKELFNKCLFADAKIATYRQRIERLFGRLCRKSKFLNSKVRVSQSELARNLVRIHLFQFNAEINDGVQILNMDENKNDE